MDYSALHGSVVGSREGMRIAVVDDDYDQAWSIAEGFRLEGFGEVVALTDGKEILSTYRSFDVVVLDLDLGGTDGIDLAEEILLHQPDKWLFVVSGESQFLKRLRQRELSLVDVVDKPIIDSKMGSIIAQVDQLAQKKWLRHQHLGRIVTSLERSAAALSDGGRPDIVAAQRGLAEAKESFRTHLLPTSRRRTAANGPSVRRSLLLLLWSVLQRLSFVPSEAFQLRPPTAPQLLALADVVRLLYQSGLTEEDERVADLTLTGVGLRPGRGVAFDVDDIFATDDEVEDLGQESGTAS